MSARVVKVRLNASGTRMIGFVDLPPDDSRVSDLLNDPDEFFIVRGEGSRRTDGGFQAIRKDAISYIEAIEEPTNPPSLRSRGVLQAVTIVLEQPKVVMMGQIFVPEKVQLIRAVNDARRFLNLTNVRFENSPEKYDYLAVAKRQILLLKT